MSEQESTHECPAPGCDKQIAFERFACPTHWFAIPAEVRAELWKQFRRHFGEESYFKARGDCLRALGVPEDQIAGENAGVD